jgi:hypothetical protein
VPQEDRKEVANCVAEGSGMFALILAAYGMEGAASRNQLPTVKVCARVDVVCVLYVLVVVVVF